MLTDQFNELLMNNDEDNVPLSSSKVMTTSIEEVTEQLNQVLMSDYEENALFSRLKVSKSITGKIEQKPKKQKKDCEEMPVKNIPKLEWKPEDCANVIGRMVKFTGGEGEKKKCHYETFEFHGKKYGLESSVLLVPEDINQKPYVAIIKDIYIQGKEGYVMLEVQWFYRPEDVEKKIIGNKEFKDSRYLFYSFHRDAVFAESVKHMCIVNFVPETKQIPKRREHPGFIVQNVYDIMKKKVRKFDGNDFSEIQRNEIDMLVAKTISRVGHLPDIEKEQQTLKSKRKQYVPKRFIIPVEKTSHASSNVVSAPNYRSTLEKFDMLTCALDRNKRLEELLEAVKHKCRVTKKKKEARDYDFFWPNDVVHAVSALEQAIYDSLANDIPKYNHEFEILVDQLKNSRLLAARLLNGELKPELIITMTPYELTRGRIFDEMKADIEDRYIEGEDPSTSKSS
ncbi:unnamed protein product [Arabis nemorensis]|uniref:BAH domain-containing protein n=1 Tax=Arabis nemorensis TaxID=586526 RepID=A0A565CE50_9BRAS|nr:unnamed protein product [Arabis nemorensis]